MRARTSDVLPPQPSAERGSALKFLGLTGAAGVVLFIGGLGLGLAAFDQTFWVENPDPAWEAAGAFGIGLVVCGVLLGAISIIGITAVGIARMSRRATH